MGWNLFVIGSKGNKCIPCYTFTVRLAVQLISGTVSYILAVLAWANVTDIPPTQSECPSGKGHIPGVRYQHNNKLSPRRTSWSWHPSNTSEPAAPQKPFANNT